MYLKQRILILTINFISTRQYKVQLYSAKPDTVEHENIYVKEGFWLTQQVAQYKSKSCLSSLCAT